MRTDVLGFLESFQGVLVGWGGSGGDPFKRSKKQSVVQCFLPMMRLIIVGAYTRRAKNKSIRPAPRSIKTGGNIATGRLEMLTGVAMGSKLLA